MPTRGRIGMVGSIAMSTNIGNQSPTIKAREAQAYPILDAGEIDRIRRFATSVRLKAGQ